MTNEKIELLHVDDSQQLVDAAAELLELEDERIEVVTATSADEGLEVLSENESRRGGGGTTGSGTDIDCVVSDYQMPDSDGLEFLEDVREEYPDLPFILFTGKGSEEIASEAISAGVTDYLQKTGGSDQYTVLANRVRNAVEQRRARTNYREIFEKASDAIFIHDPETGVVEDLNERAAEMNGYEREEMIGMTVDEFSGEDGEFNHERAKELIQKAAEEGSQTFEWLNKTKDGEEFWAEVSLKKTVINGRDHVLAVVRDVTDRKERQRQLDRTNTVLETILENLTTGILVEDPSREILAANPALCEILGTSIPAEELEGRDCSKAAEEMKGLFENPERFVRRTEEAVEGGERVLSDEFELSDGRTVERDYVPYSHPDGDTHLWLYRDITERKRRERRLERRNERLDEFAEAVSHELKNPLNVVSGRVKLAQEECDSEHLETAEEVVGRMEDIVEKSLSLARDGEEVNERREVDLESTVVECWRNVDTRDAEIRVEDDAVVEADPSRIKNVFENLFRNAVEHGTTDDSPDTGTSDDEGVTVRVGTFDGGIFVEDDGTGMGEDEMDSIFDLGYSDTEHRAGFGLAVVRRVVEAHGWEVAVGESEDGGARFEIRGVDFGETD